MRHRLAVAIVIAIAVALHWPGLHTGLFADDYLIRAMIQGEYPAQRAPWDLYSFYGGARELDALTASGTLPWWIPPELRLSLLRPLPSLLLFAEERLLGLSPFAMHLCSLAWLVGFLAAFAFYARRVLPEVAATLATALVAFDVSLVSPVAWLCNRATLISATFAALGLAAYHLHRDSGSPRMGPLAGLAFGLSLAGGEYAVCALAYVVAHELVAARDAWRERLRGLAWVLVPAALYAAFYVAGGYGASGGAIYVGPFDSPLQFLRGALIRVPSMLATEVLLLPGEAVYVALSERSPLSFWAIGPLAVAAALIAAGLRALPAPLSRRFAAYALGVVLGLVPLAGTVPGVRLLLVTSMGGSLVLAAAFWGVVERLRTHRTPATWGLALVTFPLALLHLVLSPLVTRQQATAHRDNAALMRRAALDSELDDARVAGQELVLLNQPADLVAVNYTVRARHDHGSPMPMTWRTLASALVPLSVTRVSKDTLELAVTRDGDGFFNYDERRGEHPKNPFVAGQRFSLPGLEIEILEVRGWAPARIRYRFAGDLDDPSRVFLRFERGRLVRFALPPVGSAAPLPVGWP